MDLAAGRVLPGRPPSWKCVKSPRIPLLLSSWTPGGASFPGRPCQPAVCRNDSVEAPFAKKRKGYSDERPDVEVTDDFVDEMELEEEEKVDDDDDYIIDDDNDDDDDYDFKDDFESDDEQDLFVGDGGAGGEISLAGTCWDKEALALAHQVSASFDGDLKIYAFKTAANLTIRVRIEKMSTRYGSPTIDDIEAYTIAYRAKLDDAESAGRIPQNISLEVSSPGVERVVRVPDELERFKERAMYVRYITTTSDGSATPQEGDGVLRLISCDMDLCDSASAPGV